MAAVFFFMRYKVSSPSELIVKTGLFIPVIIFSFYKFINVSYLGFSDL